MTELWQALARDGTLVGELIAASRAEAEAKAQAGEWLRDALGADQIAALGGYTLHPCPEELKGL